MSENNPSSQQTPSASAVLPEPVRQQYLDIMGIQTWYDPTLEFTVSDSPVVEKKPDEENREQYDEPPAESAPAGQLQQRTEADAIHPDMPPAASMDSLASVVEQCQLCELHTYRQQAISGEGSATAKLMIVSDAPVDDLNAADVLFKTQDKQMLMAMLKAIDIDLPSVYLTSLVKCQPPEQRAPYTSEMICCDDHLSEQIKLIQPKAILVLGELASQQLLVSQKCLSDLRLRQHQHLGIPVFVSYHPGQLFNSAENKSKVWQDLLQLNKAITV